jgi:hypothetical protein
MHCKSPVNHVLGDASTAEHMGHVQAIAISGQKMSKNEKMAKPLKQWLATLASWSDDSTLEARIRFKIKDLQVCFPASLQLLVP